jgi:PAS domain S-box-containing protein
VRADAARAAAPDEFRPTECRHALPREAVASGDAFWQVGAHLMGTHPNARLRLRIARRRRCLHRHDANFTSSMPSARRWIRGEAGHRSMGRMHRVNSMGTDERPQLPQGKRFRSLESSVMLPLLGVFGLCAAAITYAMVCAYELQHRAHLESEARLAMASVDALEKAQLTDDSLQSAVERLAWESEVTLLVIAGGEPMRVIASSRRDWRGADIDTLPAETVASDLRRVAQAQAPAMRMHDAEGQLDYTMPFGDQGVAMVHIDASGAASGAFSAALSYGAASIGAMALFGVVTALVLRRRVIDRISALATGVRVGGPSIAGLAAEESVSDEITALGEAIHHARANAELSVRELERLALVARNTTNAVVITDLERRITWVNEGFTRITGYTLDEVIGRVPGDFLQTDQTDPKAILEMREALREQRPCRVEILNRSKDGTDYWLDLEIQPVRDASGLVTGFMAIESDVTAAVSARRELAVSERRQKLIVAGAELGTWDWHIPSGEVHFNERWCEMLGYHPSEIEPHVRSWERIVHPEDAQMASDALKDHFEGRSDLYRCEHRIRAKDGSVIWVLDSGKVYERDAEGRPVRMAGIHLDITERRRAEERFELVVKGSAAGIWDWDISTGHDYFSPRWKQLLGYEEHELPNVVATWAELVHPDDLPHVTKAVEAHLAERAPYSLDYRLRTKSGEFRWFHAAGQAVWNNDGRPLRMAGSLEDVHERRVVESARARLAAIVANSEDAILGLTLDGRILSANAASGRLFGIEPGALRGRCELDLVPEAERVREQLALGRIARGERVEQYETTRLCGARGTVEVSVALSAVRDESGSIVGAAKIVRDISERREKQELLNLNDLLARQNRRLEEMTDRAHRFVDDVSHEFRTPLTVIKEYTSIIADGLGGPVSDMQQDWLQVIDVATVDLNQMVEDFLDSSKLRAGRLRVDRRSVSVMSVLAGVQKMIARKAAARQINVLQHVEPGLPPVFADEEKLRRVVMNLLTNAIKFSPEGGSVLIGARASALGDVEFSVVDHGPGLAPADLKLLFERFRQLPNALSPSVKGFGLGLNIARQLVWLNLGTISVESEPGKGAIFSFTVPAMRMETVIDRFFERLAEREEVPSLVGLLCVTRESGSVEELRRLVVASTRPTDIAVESANGRSIVVFGPTGSPETWRERLESALRTPGGGDATPSVSLAGQWSYPAECPLARAAIRNAILMEQGYAVTSAGH